MWTVYAWRGTFEEGIEIEVRSFEDEEAAGRWQRNAKKPNKVRVIRGSKEEAALRNMLWNRE